MNLTVSHWQHTYLGAEIECDVAVIGGGIIGASTAYWLKRAAPHLDVVLLEAHTVGSGATGRNAGFLLQGAAANYAMDVARFGAERARLLWAFTLENRTLIEAELDASRFELNPSGCLIAAGTEAEDEQLRLSEEQLHRIKDGTGYGAEYWPPERVAYELGSHGFQGALHIASGASIHPLDMVREIAGCSGARVLERHPVASVSFRGGKAILSTPLRRIRAERIFVALNAGVSHLFPEASAWIRPVRAQMLAAPPQPHWLPYPMYSHEGYYYIRQAPDGALLLGGARHLFEEEETGYEDRTTTGVQEALGRYFEHHFPGRPALKPDLRWSGTMAFTDDGLPLLAPCGPDRTSYWAAGFNGHGMGYGFRFGQLVARLYTTAGCDPAYHDLFSIRRLHSSS